MRKTVLTIAGSDCSGGAGIQADLKTMLANGVYGMSAVTALTAQNTMNLTAVMEVSPDFLRQQLDSIFTDIYPDAVKIGMIPSASLIETTAERLAYYDAKNIVADPVMVATNGAQLSSPSALKALKETLLPLADLVTPNITEAEVLTGMPAGYIFKESHMAEAAAQIAGTYGCAVLLKGGHRIENADDLLYYPDGRYRWFKGPRVKNPNSHGTGCTLSSAIASNLARGCDLETAVLLGKNYLQGALSAMLNLGKGSGPLDHGFQLTNLCCKNSVEF